MLWEVGCYLKGIYWEGVCSAKSFKPMKLTEMHSDLCNQIIQGSVRAFLGQQKRLFSIITDFSIKESICAYSHSASPGSIRIRCAGLVGYVFLLPRHKSLRYFQRVLRKTNEISLNSATYSPIEQSYHFYGNFQYSALL